MVVTVFVSPAVIEITEGKTGRMESFQSVVGHIQVLMVLVRVNTLLVPPAEAVIVIT
jgi:hypothetical protein